MVMGMSRNGIARRGEFYAHRPFGDYDVTVFEPFRYLDSGSVRGSCADMDLFIAVRIQFFENIVFPLFFDQGRNRKRDDIVPCLGKQVDFRECARDYLPLPVEFEGYRYVRRCFVQGAAFGYEPASQFFEALAAANPDTLRRRGSSAIFDAAIRAV